MSWNYRIVARTYEGYTLYSIREIYYDATGKVEAYTDEHAPIGDTPDDLKAELELMLTAFTRPILDYDSLPKGDSNNA